MLAANVAEGVEVTRLEQQGKAVDWPPHQLPITLAVMRMPARLRNVLEARFTGPPELSPSDRPAACAMSHTRFHAALCSSRAFIEGFLSGANERAE